MTPGGGDRAEACATSCSMNFTIRQAIRICSTRFQRIAAPCLSRSIWGKPGRDARGHNYVVVVQVAPHDIVSRHARVFGSAGPGIEVAKNQREPLSRLQAVGGILVATIVKRAVPKLRMVHHRGTEGRPMLRAYRARRAAWKRARGGRRVRLPFVAADPVRVASAAGSLGSLIVHTGPVRTIPPGHLHGGWNECARRRASAPRRRGPLRPLLRGGVPRQGRQIRRQRRPHRSDWSRARVSLVRKGPAGESRACPRGSSLRRRRPAVRRACPGWAVGCAR